jgi:two-component system, NtrC family, response regulator HydG
MNGIWRPRLLVVEDEPATLALVDGMARTAGFELITRQPGPLSSTEVSAIGPDAALFDIDRSDRGGRELLRTLREDQPECQIVLTTEQANADSAIDAVKLGVLDYLPKPIDRNRLDAVLVTIRKNGERRETLLQAEGKVASQFEFYGMIGRSPAMQELFDAIRRLAPHVRSALITGETGTGKELVARALHQLGARPDQRFATVNCSAVVETLFESELFGHVRGAFAGATEATKGLFESADGGTLFLDEIGELPTPMQAKLLRAVEYGEVQQVGSLDTRRVNVRVIAATNHDLLDQSRIGKFRSDLYYRLSVVEIHLPPLRERREDIPYLTASFVRSCAQRIKKTIVGVSASAERVLLDADWPGNIRELQNVLERACVLSHHRLLSDRDVIAAMPRQMTSYIRSVTPIMRRPVNGRGDLLRTAKREQILQTLRDVGGNKAEAARQLGVGRRSLYRWLERMQPSADPPPR